MKQIYTWLLLTIIFMIGCTPKYMFTKPHGFADYKLKNDTYRAISSDGIKIKVYYSKNEPYGSPAMWMESTDNYLTGIGYAKLATTEIATQSNLKGVYNEYRYVYYGKVYVYSVSIFADKELIYIIETSGLDKYYPKRKEAVLEAIRKFKLT